MAIIKCPECGHQISEKATICPSCGVEIAGKIVKCLGCGEVFFKDDGLCPHCYRPYKVTSQMGSDSEDQVPEEMTPSVEKTVSVEENGDDKPSNGYLDTPSEDDIVPTDNNTSSSVQDDGLPEENSNTAEIVETQEKDEEEEDKNLQDEEDDVDDNEGTEELSYIDTDEENLERPVHEVVDDEQPSSKHGYMPVVVSIAITALIAAVCFYFYNDSKMSRETQAFEVALKSGDIDQMNKFLRDHDDATQAHKQSIKDRIQQLENEAVEEQDYAYCIATRDKAKIVQYLNDNPETSHKNDIITLLDSIDWEDALKSNTRAAFEKYIAEHQTGAFVKDAKDKLAVQLVASTEEDNAMARSLFREFFLSVNADDAGRLTPTLNSQITNFMGTESASSNDVISWMKRQHKEDVSSVIWKLNHDYKIDCETDHCPQGRKGQFRELQNFIRCDRKQKNCFNEYDEIHPAVFRRFCQYRFQHHKQWSHASTETFCKTLNNREETGNA